MPRATLLVTQRPRPGLGRLLPTLETLGAPALSVLAAQLGDGLPPPFHLMPQHVVVLATDAASAAAGWRAGAGLVAGLGSGSQAVAQLAAGAELVLHGHDHTFGREVIEGRDGPVPVLGIDSYRA
ncbi:MAG TPA: hypothetical protein DCZ11_09475 [Gammaproteobacteria bacterium]|nr:hypothetical protein [Gammaproteobacteria bacterium]MCH78662.1 hypothetical protein [Gammaproteobacteria bacterium]